MIYCISWWISFIAMIVVKPILLLKFWRRLLSYFDPKMASLHLTFEDLGDVPSDDKIFYLIRDYLQPRTTLTLRSTSEAIVKPLEGQDVDAADSSMLGEICIDLAEQIPYYHPSQSKIVRLLESLFESRHFREVRSSDVGCMPQRSTPDAITEVKV